MAVRERITILDGGDVLPGFRVPVKACFERMPVKFE